VCRQSLLDAKMVIGSAGEKSVIEIEMRQE
jgi:hypothetical protein